MYISGQRSWGLNIMQIHVSSSASLLRLKHPAKYKKCKYNCDGINKDVLLDRVEHEYIHCDTNLVVNVCF